jgi:ATP-dependent DNA helicase RecQ
VLRYFGDPAARPRCEGCDNCLGIRHVAREGGPAKKNGRVAKAKVAGPTSAPLSSDEQSRMETLRTLRAQLAKEDEVPAYVIFPDRTLREIARERPRDLAALAKVSGVGPTRLERFGKQVLAALSSPVSDTGRSHRA